MGWFGSSKKPEAEPLLQNDKDIEANNQPQQKSGFAKLLNVNWMSFPYASLVIVLYEIFQTLSFLPVVYLIALRIFDSYILSEIGYYIGRFYEIFINDDPYHIYKISGITLGLYLITTMSSSLQNYVADRWSVASRRILTKKLIDNQKSIFGFSFGSRGNKDTEKEEITEDCENLCDNLAAVANDLAGVPFQIFYNTLLVWNIYQTIFPSLVIWLAYTVGGFIYWLVNRKTTKKEGQMSNTQSSLTNAQGKQKTLLQQSQEQLKQQIEQQKAEKAQKKKEEEQEKKERQDKINKQLAEKEVQDHIAELQKSKSEKEAAEKKKEDQENKGDQQNSGILGAFSSSLKTDDGKKDTGSQKSSGLLSFGSKDVDQKQKSQSKDEIEPQASSLSFLGSLTSTSNSKTLDIQKSTEDLNKDGIPDVDQQKKALDDQVAEAFSSLAHVKYQLMLWDILLKAQESVLENMGTLLNFALLSWYIFIYRGTARFGDNAGDVAQFVTNSTFYILTLVKSLTAIFKEASKLNTLQESASDIGSVLIKIRTQEREEKHKKEEEAAAGENGASKE